MTSTRSRRDLSLNQDQPLDPSESWIESGVTLLIAVAVLFVSLALTFLTPSPTGDTFMTLAGGRDVVDGKLGQADQWSFMTDGRVWINQSWLTGWLFYVLWQQLGYVGLVWYKAVMIAVIALFGVLAARRLKAGYPIAILVAAFTLCAASSFINIRANLLGLAMLAVLIWLLYFSAGRPQRIWWSVALLAVWAHLHGSFIFGIGVLGLWAVVQIGIAWWQGGRAAALRGLWPLPVATVLVIVLAAATSPFGVTNLTQPFSLIGLFVDEPWPLENTEMVPLLNDHPYIKSFPGLPWYLLMLGCLAAPLAVRGLGPSHDLAPIASLDDRLRTMWIFTLALSTVGIVMALLARRFVPISLIACAPLLASEWQRLFSHRRYAWPTTVVIIGTVCCGILWQRYSAAANAGQANLLQGIQPAVQRKIWMTAMPVIAFAPVLYRRLAGLWWDRDRGAADPSRGAAWPGRRNRAWALASLMLVLLLIVVGQLQQQLPVNQRDAPLHPSEDLFGRLVMIGTFPEQAMKFLEANHINGNVLNDWQWEGFLYWHRPLSKVMLGGRSRQIYTPGDVRRTQQANGADDRSVYTEMGITLILTHANEALANRLFSEVNSPWQIIYFDGLAIVAALRDDPETDDLISRFKANRLLYPSAKAQRYTAAARQLALSSDSSASRILAAVSAATQIQASLRLYQLFVFQQKRALINKHDIAAFFAAELGRLDGRDGHRRFGIEELSSRSFMAEVVATYYGTTTPPDKQRSFFWKKYSEQCAAAAEAVTQHRRDVEISEIPAEYTAATR